MRSMVISITTGSSSAILTSKHHFFIPKHQPFVSSHTLLPLSFSKPVSPPSPSSSPSSPPILISPNLFPQPTPTNLTHFAETASSFVEHGKFDEFKLLVESVISSEGGMGSGFSELLNSEVLLCGVVKGLKEGRIKSLIGLFRCFSELGVDVLRVFDGEAMRLLKRECCSIVHKGLLEEAVELMEVLAGLRFKIKDLVRPSDLIRMFVNKRRPYLAVRYACLLPRAEVVFCTTIKEFGKRLDLLSAETVFEASKQKLNGHNMYIYRTMIDVCGLCGNCLKSRLIFEDMLNQNVRPNIFVFNSLMNVNSHDLTYTMELYKKMQGFSVQADMTSYNILLKACCLSETVDLAQDIYSEVQCLQSTGVLKLDVFTYSTIIKVFADAKLWQMAIKIKEDMISAGVTPNTVTWSSLISACANAGLVDRATQLFEEMLLAGCEPNSLCYNTLLHACVEACQYDRAFRLFNAWKSSGSSEKSTEKSSSDTSITSIHPVDKVPLTRSTHFDTATHNLSFSKRIPFKPTTATYNTLMKACGTDFYHAKELMDEMKALDISPDKKSWSILIDICGATGNVPGALQILQTMGESGMKPDVVAYTTAIKVCVESKNLKTAVSLFAEMKRNCVKPNMVTYNTLLRGRSKYGSIEEIQQCLAIYQDMRRAGFKANDYYLKLLIEEWCEGVIQKKNQEQEYKLRDRADISGLRSLLLDRVATHLQKNTAESLAVDVQGLTKVEARLVVLAGLRMIRENYLSGRSVQDDLVVILGLPQSHTEFSVEEFITKLLKMELGLEVRQITPSFIIVPKTVNSSDSNSEGILESSQLLTPLDANTRRPAVLRRLVVTKKSLDFWLKKTNTASRR